MREGIYRLYRLYVDDRGQTQRRMLGRFVLYGEMLTTLEDHDGVVEGLAPDGRVTGDVLARLKNISSSPYWELIHEEEIQGGEHEHLLPEVEEAGPEAWPTQEGE